MRCPICGEAELVRDTRDQLYTYKGQETVIKAVTADFCDACGESITDKDETTRVMGEMLAFNQRVNASICDPDFIIKTRKKLGLSQKEAAEIFGGGVNAFSRYETRNAQPSQAMILLFKLLNKRPELLKEIN